MATIQVGHQIPFDPPLSIDQTGAPYRFERRTTDDRSIAIFVGDDGKAVTSATKVEISEATAEQLQSTSAPVTGAIAEELLALARPARIELQRFAGLLRQELGLHHEDTWGFAWCRVGGGSALRVAGKVRVDFQFKVAPSALTPARAEALQGAVERGETELIAYEFLRGAASTRNAKLAWIQAAAAAELGIKEVLVRLAPTLETLLLEVPAPAVDKLYSKILLHYGKEKSPYVSKLREGAAIRNKLIHSLARRSISGQDCSNYQLMVGNALRHLVDLCRRHEVTADPTNLPSFEIEMVDVLVTVDPGEPDPDPSSGSPDGGQ